MMGLFSIVKKELSRFFRDRRMVLTTLLLPGLLIYCIYSFLGSGLDSFLGQGESDPYAVTANRMPAVLAPYVEAVGESMTVTVSEGAEAIASLDEEGYDLVVFFPEDFEEKLDAYLRTGEGQVPAPTLYYYSANARSAAACELMMGILSSLEASVNPPMMDMSLAMTDLSSEEDMATMFYSMLLPLLLVMLLFSGCMAVAPESIAGEKERGTIATLLVTPLKRTHLALGKIFSLSLIALLSGISSTIGILLSLPKLMGEELSGGISFAMYDIGDFFALFGIVLSTVLVIVSLVSVVSAYARSVKEATTYVSPFMVLVAVLGVSTMFTSSAMSLPLYMIPLFNSINCLSSVFSGSYGVFEILVTVGANVAFTALFAYILTRMFNSEKIMFKR